MTNPQDITITTADQQTLTASLFEAEQHNGRVVLINSAMGVKRGFYAKYAAFLAANGFHVLTYDYRGIGASRPAGSLRGFKAALWQWGAVDQAALIDWITARYPQHKLLVIGHSVGGQLVGFTPQNKHIHALLGVSAQSGYWRGWDGGRRLFMFVWWHGIIPLTTALFGYLPGRLFGSGEDVPAGVAREWAQAGRKPNYVRDLYRATAYDHFESFTAPIRAYSFSDDSFATYKSVENLLALYPNAQHEHCHVTPLEVQAQQIGHFGFFRKTFESTLWTQSAAWLAGV